MHFKTKFLLTHEHVNEFSTLLEWKTDTKLKHRKRLKHLPPLGNTERLKRKHAKVDYFIANDCHAFKRFELSVEGFFVV